MEQIKLLTSMNEKLDRVEGALLGDPKYGSIGLVNRVGNLETRTVNKRSIIRWSLSGFIALCSGVFGLIKYLT